MTNAPDPSLQADAAPDLTGGGPSYYRLDDAAWAQIAEQYRAGATAKTLAALWRVSPGSVYRHACAGGWTKAKRSSEVSQLMVSRERERLAHAEQIAGEAAAAQAPREAEPLDAAQTLLRRGAGSALKGRGEQARGELGLAQDLLRCARLLAEARGAVFGGKAGVAVAPPEEEEEAPQPTPEETARLDADLEAGLRRRQRRLGRRPPQTLPLCCSLPDYPHYRRLAEALEVIDDDGVAHCEDFEAAVAACRAAGRGDLLDAALKTPVPFDECFWMDEEMKALVAADEAQTGCGAGRG